MYRDFSPNLCFRHFHHTISAPFYLNFSSIHSMGQKKKRNKISKLQDAKQMWTKLGDFLVEANTAKNKIAHCIVESWEKGREEWDLENGPAHTNQHVKHNDPR